MEGHGQLDIKVKGGKVEYAKLKITESKRFYTQAIRNKFALSLPLMTSRICGTCSIAHLTCCSEAVERAFDYTPSDQTLLLRKLSLYGMMIRDHALHLFMFCLPDLFGKDSDTGLRGRPGGAGPEGLRDKERGQRALEGDSREGGACHLCRGGKFSHMPDPEAIKKVVAELKAARGYAIEAMELFYNCDFRLDMDTDFVALETKDFSFFRGTIVDSKGLRAAEEKYWDYLERVDSPLLGGHQLQVRGQGVHGGRACEDEPQQGSAAQRHEEGRSEVPVSVPVEEHLPQQPRAGDRDTPLHRPLYRDPGVKSIQRGAAPADCYQGGQGRRPHRGAERNPLLHARHRQDGEGDLREHNSADPAEPDNHGEERGEACGAEPRQWTGTRSSTR